MNDTHKTLNKRYNYAEAIVAVDLWLKSQGAINLKDYEFRQITRAEYTTGWKTKFQIKNDIYEIFVLVDRRFPFSPAQLYLQDKSMFAELPHIEEDGYICGISSASSLNPNKPIETLKAILLACHNVLAGNYKLGNKDDEFKREFLSYWRPNKSAKPIRSLLTKAQQVKDITIWFGKAFTLAADNEHDAQNWLSNYSPTDKHRDFTFSNGLLIPLDEPMTPAQFPETAQDVLTIISDQKIQAQDKLKEAICDRKKELLVVFQTESEKGLGFLAVKIQHNQIQKRGPHKQGINTLTKGFRNGQIPKTVTQQRLLGGRKIQKMRVDRFDPSWVHGRDNISTVELLEHKHVVIIGCGSIGSTVAIQLAKMGVGNFTLFDPEILDSANIGRHALGIQSVGQNKSIALKKYLTSEFPHIRNIDASKDRIEDYLNNSSNIFNESSVILSAIGDWKTEGYFNRHIVNNQYSNKIIYAWTEPFAAAGHAVTTSTDWNRCFSCGLDDYGRPILRVSEWPSPTLVQEPACGVMYQPYGPIELGYIHSVISQAVMDALLEQVTADTSHKIWCGHRNLVSENGGKWTDNWLKISHNNTNGGQLFQIPWTKNMDCDCCGVNNAD